MMAIKDREAQEMARLAVANLAERLNDAHDQVDGLLKEAEDLKDRCSALEKQLAEREKEIAKLETANAALERSLEAVAP